MSENGQVQEEGDPKLLLERLLSREPEDQPDLSETAARELLAFMLVSLHANPDGWQEAF